MKYRIGIPRALLYYQFATLWHTFFRELDVEVVVSGESNKRVLDEGALRVVDEACLPVKIYFGHAAELAKKELDFLFIPRIVSIEKRAYICPKLMGLPDMLSAYRAPLPPLLKPTLNLVRSSRGEEAFLREIEEKLGCDCRKTKRAWLAAQEKYRRERLQVSESCILRQDALQKKEPVLFLLGHPYLLKDSYLNLNLLKKLEGLGCHIVLPEHVPAKIQEAELGYLQKPLFWTYGKNQLGSVRFFTRQQGLKGVIILTAFGCGIDSFIDNMVIRHLKKTGVPHLCITLDEHTGEAGVDTRIEAFIDMIHWRRPTDESNFSSYGQCLGNFERIVGIPGVECSSSAPYH